MILYNERVEIPELEEALSCDLCMQYMHGKYVLNMTVTN